MADSQTPSQELVKAAVAAAVSEAVQKEVAPLAMRLKELEAATVSHIAQTVAGGATGGHWAKWFEKFKHLVGVADAVAAVLPAGVPPGVQPVSKESKP